MLNLQRVQPWRMYPERGIFLQKLLTKVAQHAFWLLRFLAVRSVRCQLCACLTSESLHGSFLASFCSDRVCCTSHLPAKPPLFFCKGRRLCCLTASNSITVSEEGVTVIWLQGSRLAPRYAGGGAPFLLTSRGCGPRGLIFLKYISRVFCFQRCADYPVCGVACQSTIHLTWVGWPMLVYLMHKARCWMMTEGS